jgi:predicted transcriptional regulator of viral defense system
MTYPIVFNTGTFSAEYANKKQLWNAVFKASQKGELKIVRKGLYAAVDNITGNVYANKFQIASKISDSAYLAYHSALEFFGLSNQVFDTLTVCSSSKFNAFEFDGINYQYQKSNTPYFVEDRVEVGVKVTSLERTIVDCIDNINLAGGIEEVLNAFEQIKIVDDTKVSLVLKEYHRKSLYQKVGYVLEHFKNHLQLSNSFFDECQKNIGKKTIYFLNQEYQNVAHNKNWNIIAPKKLLREDNE